MSRSHKVDGTPVRSRKPGCGYKYEECWRKRGKKFAKKQLSKSRRRKMKKIKEED
jgi:hypothetical protein